MPVPNKMDSAASMRLLTAYDNYIKDFVEEKRPLDGDSPVCLDEFYDNEYQEIINAEKTTRGKGVFLEITWSIDDLKAAFRNRGINPTKENIRVFINSRSPQKLEEASIDCGWSILDDIVSGLQCIGRLPAKIKKAS